ncbi:hypothetical protein BD311DRAFT_99012 [Dichomitus squalens]|uniref:Uncharacterized protein n=1 Tax=Dichomitus squalens TaxID=114155 RepID=A0A4Q9MUH8_9APHY|nr:hypothetical protein BD311DRAFT_99012 [Dichomitus squalens]TBU64437.1 hypothetical protein BD310DRAFT_397601 [Dichomitus squalens]
MCRAWAPPPQASLSQLQHCGHMTPALSRNPSDAVRKVLSGQSMEVSTAYRISFARRSSAVRMQPAHRSTKISTLTGVRRLFMDALRPAEPSGDTSAISLRRHFPL